METPDFIDSKFRLAILAAKRAKQLVQGARKKIDINAENPLSIALEEIARGKISFQICAEEDVELSKVDVSLEEVETEMDAEENFLELEDYEEDEEEVDDEEEAEIFEEEVEV